MAIIDEGITIEVMDHQGIVLVEIAGELTALEAPELLSAVGDVLAASPRNLQLGLRFVTFLDSGGLQALLRARALTQAAAVPLQLLGPPRRVCRLLEVMNLTGVFDIVE